MQMKVLVCDDCQKDLERVAALLAEPCRKIRAQLTAVSRPQELEDLSGFDLAFLDIDMKGMDGLTLARRRHCVCDQLCPVRPRGVRGAGLPLPAETHSGGKAGALF